MTTSRKLLRRGLPALGVIGALLAGQVSGVEASSHREAPLITEDPVADLTDVYAFVSPDDANKVTLIANVIPFEEPAGGPNFHKFGDDVLYQLNVSNDGDPQAEKEYQFRFTTTYANPNTFLYNTGQVTTLDDADLNVRQTYSVTEVDKADRQDRGAGQEHPGAPGQRRRAIHAGLRGQPRLQGRQEPRRRHQGLRRSPRRPVLRRPGEHLRPRRPAAVQPRPPDPPARRSRARTTWPVTTSTASPSRCPKAELVKGNEKTIGVWATTYRRSQRILNANKPGVLNHKGNWVQVARLGMPLVNEVVIPVGQKDKFNGSQPANDGQFAASVLKPELANLIPVLYPGVKVPTERRPRPRTGRPGGHRHHLPHRHPGREPARGRRAVGDAAAQHLDGLGLPERPAPHRRRDGHRRSGRWPEPRRSRRTSTSRPTRTWATASTANDQPFTGSFPYLAAPASGYDS